MLDLLIEQMVSWLLQPANNALLTWASFFIGLIGLALTLAGLGIALRQLSAIKSETEATKNAINAVQIKLEAFDASRQCELAIQTISEVRKNLRAKDLDGLLTNYESLLDAFINLRHSSSVITDEDRAQIGNLSDLIARLCEGIRRSLDDPDKPFPKGHDSAIRRIADILVKINFYVTKDLRK